MAKKICHPLGWPHLILIMTAFLWKQGKKLHAYIKEKTAKTFINEKLIGILEQIHLKI